MITRHRARVRGETVPGTLLTPFFSPQGIRRAGIGGAVLKARSKAEADTLENVSHERQKTASQGCDARTSKQCLPSENGLEGHASREHIRRLRRMDVTLAPANSVCQAKMAWRAMFRVNTGKRIPRGTAPGVASGIGCVPRSAGARGDTFSTAMPWRRDMRRARFNNRRGCLGFRGM